MEYVCHVGTAEGRVMRQVLAYTTAVQDLNKTKDSLKNVLSAAQAPVSTRSAPSPC